jgi:hypothetical protein
LPEYLTEIVAVGIFYEGREYVRGAIPLAKSAHLRQMA